MKDAFAAAAVFSGICAGLLVLIYLLSCWHKRIDRRLRGFGHTELEREAALSEAGYYDRSPHVRRLAAHVKRRNEGRHYDAA